MCKSSGVSLGTHRQEEQSGLRRGRNQDLESYQQPGQAPFSGHLSVLLSAYLLHCPVLAALLPLFSVPVTEMAMMIHRSVLPAPTSVWFPVPKSQETESEQLTSYSQGSRVMEYRHGSWAHS